MNTSPYQSYRNWFDNSRQPKFNIYDVMNNPKFRDQINNVCDVLDITRWKAAKMIRQSLLGVG